MNNNKTKTLLNNCYKTLNGYDYFCLSNKKIETAAGI